MLRLTRSLALAAALAAPLVYSPATATAVEPALPDLGMARLSDLRVAITADGQKQLRFSATIVNVGAGTFELGASRPNQVSPFAVNQHVFASDGSTSIVPVDVDLVFGGDGHSHFHIRDLEVYELRRLDNGVKVGTGMKSGFCFFDTTAYRLSLPGAPQSSVYDSSGCGHVDSLDVTMGLSVGWGDRYPWSLPDQYIDVTALSNGKYRLLATADPLGLFTEGNYGNNLTWVDISLSKRGVKVLRWGPSA